MCNYVKFETRLDLPPVLKIVTRTALTLAKFCPDYMLLSELHALTLATRSYALLLNHLAMSRFRRPYMLCGLMYSGATEYKVQDGL